MVSKKKMTMLFTSLLISASAIGSVMPSTGIIDWFHKDKTDKSENRNMDVIEFVNKESEKLAQKKEDGSIQLSDYVDALSQSSNMALSSFSQNTNNYKQSYLSFNDDFIPGINEENCRNWYKYIMSQAGNSLASSTDMPIQQLIGLTAMLDLGALGGYMCPTETSEGVVPWSANVAFILFGQDVLTYFNPNPPFRMINSNEKATTQKFVTEKPMLQMDTNFLIKEIKELASKINKDKESGKITQKALVSYANDILAKFFKLYSSASNAVPKNQMLKAVTPETCKDKYSQISQWAISSLDYNYSDKPMSTEQLIAFIIALNAGSFGGALCPTDIDDPDSGLVPWVANQSVLTVLHATLYNLSPVDR